MRAREFMEQAPFKANTEKNKTASALQKDLNIPIMPVEKDWRTDTQARKKKEKEQALELPPISPDDLIGAGLLKGPAVAAVNTVSKKAGKNIGTKIQDLGYDLANKPSVFNPITAKNIGKDVHYAQYHAANAFRKKYGQEPPTWDIKNDIERFGGKEEYRKIYKDYSDMSSDFLNRGYRYNARIPNIGSNVDGQDLMAQTYKRMPPTTLDKVKDVADEVSLTTARQTADLVNRAVANRNNDENN